MQWKGISYLPGTNLRHLDSVHTKALFTELSRRMSCVPYAVCHVCAARSGEVEQPLPFPERSFTFTQQQAPPGTPYMYQRTSETVRPAEAARRVEQGSMWVQRESPAVSRPAGGALVASQRDNPFARVRDIAPLVPVFCQDL